MTDVFEMLRYLAVGGLVTVADMVVYNLLTGEPRRMPRVSANILSVTVGMILGFTLHFALVFQPREALIAERLTKYVLVGGVSVYGVQNLVIYTLAELWRSPVRLAQTLTQNLSEKWVERATTPFGAATCRQKTRRLGHPKQQPASVAPEFHHSPRYSDDFIDRIFGKMAAALAGVIWNFVFFKWFVYA